jgi:hypothetical protein
MSRNIVGFIYIAYFLGEIEDSQIKVLVFHVALF